MQIHHFHADFFAERRDFAVEGFMKRPIGDASFFFAQVSFSKTIPL